MYNFHTTFVVIIMQKRVKTENMVLGVMSGTSLDGLDIALVHFQKKERWTYRIHAATTIPYPKVWAKKLARCALLSKEDLAQLDVEYTHYLGNTINQFLKEEKASIDFISSHGHTVFHQPDQGLTYQMGNLPDLAKITGHQVICDFRVADVALKGQGAPLVPGGEVHLFSEYDACINLGGFANITRMDVSPVVAYDICPVNIVMNALVHPLGLKYDNDGALARSGTAIPSLITALNQLAYYKAPYPKSLGIEWVASTIDPLLLKYKNASIADLLHSFSLHCAHQIQHELPEDGRVLFSGGGCHNSFLIELIQAQSKAKIVLPSAQIIEFKEAVVFAFLGVLRQMGEVNCLASVTGALNDHSSGKIFLP